MPASSAAGAAPSWAQLAAALAIVALMCDAFEMPLGSPSVACGPAANLEEGLREEEEDRPAATTGPGGQFVRRESDDGCVSLRTGLGESAPTSLQGTQMGLVVVASMMPSLWDSDLGHALQLALVAVVMGATFAYARHEATDADNWGRSSRYDATDAGYETNHGEHKRENKDDWQKGPNKYDARRGTKHSGGKRCSRSGCCSHWASLPNWGA